MSEPKIIEVSETQRGQWIETKWSDGCITLHRRAAESDSPQAGDDPAYESALRIVKEHCAKFGRRPLAAYLLGKRIYHYPTAIPSSTEDFRRAIEEVYGKEQLENRRAGLLC